MTPAQQVCELLGVARRTGVPFAAAWPAAVTRALAAATASDSADWAAALNATRYAWQAAWERRPPTRAQRSLRAVAFDPERAPLDTGDSGTYCDACDAPILTTDSRAKYCSPRCRRDAYSLRQEVLTGSLTGSARPS